MLSESDESTYTVHDVPFDEQPASREAQPATQVAEEAGPANTTDPTKSPLARYYRLGTQERHAFDEHMRHVRQESAAQEVERQFRASHPFQPQRGVSPATRSSADHHVTNAAPSRQLNTGSTSDKPVFDRLAAQAAQLELRRRHREEQQRRAEAVALRGAFQPLINQVAPAQAERLKHLDSVPVEERLLHYGENVARERQRKQELKELEEVAAWKAARAAAVGSSGQQPPDAEERRRQHAEFEARSARFLAERDQHRQSAEATAAAAFSFQPRISTTSAALDEARQRLASDVRRTELSHLLSRSVNGTALGLSNQQSAANASRRSDALYALAVSRQRTGREEDAANGNGPRTGNTLQGGGTKGGMAGTGPDDAHHPFTNPTSDKWIAKSAHRSFFEKDFVRRQTLYEEVKREEVALLASVLQQEEDKEMTAPSQLHQPSSGTAAPVQKVDERQLAQRLYYDAQKTSEAATRRREAALMAHECPFRPQLSPGTRNVLRHLDTYRDSNVVRRLTTQQRGGAATARGHDAEMERDLYAPAPARTPRLQGSHRMPSSARSSKPAATLDAREAALAVAAQGRSVSPAKSVSPRGPSSRGSVECAVEASRAGDAVPATAPPPQEPPQQQQQQQQQQPARQRRPTVTRDQIEHFYQRQITALQQRQDLIQERKEGEAVQELVECTFRPRTNNSGSHGESSEPAPGGGAGAATSLNRVTGVMDFLERQAAARQRKAEHEETVRNIGLPRQRGTGGTSSSGGGVTVLSPFKLQTEKRRQRTSLFPADGRGGGERNVFSVAGLTAAERALHDVLAESRQSHGAAARAPLSALPGYSETEGDGVVHTNDPMVYDYEGGEAENVSVSGVASANSHLQHADIAPVYSIPGSRGLRHEQVSLFSAISPNTFSGRSLGAAQAGHSGGKCAGPGPSALKGAVPQPTEGSQRRRHSRSVSFAVEDTGEPRAADAPRGHGARHLDAAHLAFLRGQT